MDTGILDYRFIPVQPTSQIVVNGPIEFQVTPPTFCDLSKSKLRLKLKLENGGGKDVLKIENLSKTVPERKKVKS